MSDLCQVLGPGWRSTGVRCGWAAGNETRASLNQPPADVEHTCTLSGAAELLARDLTQGREGGETPRPALGLSY